MPTATPSYCPSGAHRSDRAAVSSGWTGDVSQIQARDTPSGKRPVPCGTVATVAETPPGARNGPRPRSTAQASRTARMGLWFAMGLCGPLTIGPAAAIAAPVVIVAYDPDASLSQRRLLEALNGQLAELGLEVLASPDPALGPEGGDTETAARDRDVLAFVWVEQTPDALVVHFYEPAGASLRERRIPVTGTDAASLEEIAIVVRSAASALLERARTAAEAPPVPSPSEAPPLAPGERPPPTPAPPPVPRATARSGPVGLSLGYIGSRYSADWPWTHGARAAMGWHSARSRWRLGIAYTSFPTAEQRAESATFSLARHPVEVFLGPSLPLGRSNWRLQPDGGIGADSLRRRTLRVNEALEPTPDTTRWSWFATTRLALAWEPAPPLTLFAAGGADYLLNRVEQVADSRVLVAPLRVRPRLELGLSLAWPRRSPPELTADAH